MSGPRHFQLSDDQVRRLESLAAAERRSLADLLHEAIELVLTRARESEVHGRRRRALAVVGRYRSGIGNVAGRHDDHLGDLYAT